MSPSQGSQVSENALFSENLKNQKRWFFQNIIHFYDLARHAVDTTSENESKVTWNVIKDACGDLLYQLSSMKFKDPVDDGEGIVVNFL